MGKLIDVRKIVRLYHTIRQIKVVQLVYQLWYRLKKKFTSIGSYGRYTDAAIYPVPVSVPYLLKTSSQEVYSAGHFCFLNLEQRFAGGVDWNFSDHGKLWNYNLQYFNYLLDDRIDVSLRTDLLRNFSVALLRNEVLPEPYPVSLRIVNGLLFYTKHQIEDDDIRRALLHQIDYLEHNLEYHLLANHLLENAFSLYIAALYLRDERLYKKSAKLLREQLKEQILEDGGHYECSPMYQSILLSKLFLCIEAAGQSDIASLTDKAFMKEKAGAMLGWINAYSFPDGSWALMNDAAEGIAPTTHQLNDAARYLGLQPKPVKLSGSGFRKMSGDGWEIVIKTGKVQPSYQPGHTHADMLGFCLWYKGRQVIADPGISTYNLSARRLKERSTEIHNTVSVNGINQSDVWGGFRIGKRAGVSISSESAAHIEACVEKYGGRPITHHRKFLKKDESTLVISDEIKTGNTIPVAAQGSLQFGENITVTNAEMGITIGDVTLRTNGAKFDIEPSTLAVSYNDLKPSKRAVYTVSPSCELQFHFL